MDQTIKAGSVSAALSHGLFEGVERQVGLERAAGLPTHDAPRIHVGYERDVSEPRPGPHIGQIHHPQAVRSHSDEVPVNQITGPHSGVVADRGVPWPARSDTTKPQITA